MRPGTGQLHGGWPGWRDRPTCRWRSQMTVQPGSLTVQGVQPAREHSDLGQLRQPRQPCPPTAAAACLPTASRRKKKSVVARVLSSGTKVVVIGLLLVACGGWLWTHQHKTALTKSLTTTVTNLNSAHQVGACSCG